MAQNLKHDVLILGAGLAGLRAAVEIARRTDGKADIGIVSKVQLMRAHSVCAEGGTGAVLRTDEGDSLDLHAWDTLKGSDFLADQDVVYRFVETSPKERNLRKIRCNCSAVQVVFATNRPRRKLANGATRHESSFRLRRGSGLWMSPATVVMVASRRVSARS